MEEVELQLGVSFRVPSKTRTFINGNVTCILNVGKEKILISMSKGAYKLLRSGTKVKVK